jgi:PDZ domain-containing protein
VGLIDAVIPGARIVRTGDIVPSGVSTRQFDLGMDDAMLESQEVAAVVAERAAGYRVPVPRSRLIVVRFAPASLAKRELRPGDVVVAVGGRPVESRSDLERTLGAVSPGKFVDVTVSRGNALRRFRVATIAYDRRTALGVYLGALFERANLPVPVRYSVHAISGSSGGLMFALQIYETLKHSAPRTPVAGTGTLGYDGIVGAIEGARQKLVAARRAGATVFLVPQENYPEIAGTTGIRIVPVKTFAQALRAIE